MRKLKKQQNKTEITQKTLLARYNEFKLQLRAIGAKENNNNNALKRMTKSSMYQLQPRWPKPYL